MGCGAENKYLVLEDRRGEVALDDVRSFSYLRVKIYKEGGQAINIKNIINKGRAITAMLNDVLWN